MTSRKGRAGKTTIAVHFAVEARRTGADPVAIIDTDPMQGIEKSWRIDESGTVTPYIYISA